MREAGIRPTLHLFVCANERAPGPLGEGCGARGEAVYAALKASVAARGAHAAVWVTKTYCLGLCPKTGCTVAMYPSGRIVAEVEPGDAAKLLDTE
jgi:hypothetical protein